MQQACFHNKHKGNKKNNRSTERLFFMQFTPSVSMTAATILLRFPKSLFGLEHRAILTATPSSPRFIRHRRHFGDEASGRKAIKAPSLREDSPTVWGKCHEVTKRDGRVTLSVRTEGVSAVGLAPPSGVKFNFYFSSEHTVPSPDWPQS